MTDSEKTSKEEQKLRHEIEDLRRPFFHRPAFWLSAATAVVTIVGAWQQGMIAEVKKERALSAVEKTEKDAAIATERLDEAQALERTMRLQVSELRKQESETEHEVQLLTARLQSARLAFDSVEAGLAFVRATTVDEKNRRRTDEVSSAGREAIEALTVEPRAAATMASWNIENAWRKLDRACSELVANGFADIGADVSVLLEVSLQAATQIVSELEEFGLCYRLEMLEQRSVQHRAYRHSDARTHFFAEISAQI